MYRTNTLGLPKYGNVLFLYITKVVSSWPCEENQPEKKPKPKTPKHDKKKAENNRKAKEDEAAITHTTWSNNSSRL